MRRTLTITVALLAGAAILAAPASAAKPALKPHQLAKQECRAEKRADKQAFKAVYGKRAMRTCVSRETAEVREQKRNAARDCKGEREEMGIEAFRERHGSQRTGENAFGRCVSSKVRAEQRAERRAFANAAKTCKEQRTADPDAFRGEWGTAESSGHSALGKCVSATAKQQQEDEADEEDEGNGGAEG